MKVLTSLNDYQKKKNSCLSIGYFDGMHLGHQHLLQQVTKKAKTIDGESVVITFKPSLHSHPSKQLLIHTLEHRLLLFKKQSISTVILLDFTPSFAQLSAESFFHMLMEKIPFSHLFIGSNATLGHKQEGNKEKICSLSKKLSFSPFFIPLYQNISSTMVRDLICKGQLQEIEKLLGRKYSTVFSPQQNLKNEFGIFSMQFPLKGLSSLPSGSWMVKVHDQNRYYDGIAKIRKSPSHSSLEIYFLQNISLDHPIEIIFLQQLNESIEFDSTMRQKIQQAHKKL